MPNTRLVVVDQEYLDGIQMAEAKTADEHTGPTARRIPVAVIEAYDEA